MRAKLVERLHGAGEADLSRRQLVRLGRLSHDLTNQIVGQQVRPYFLAHHLRGLAAQDVHLHLGFDRAQIDFCMPAFVIEIEDLLLAVSFMVGQSGHDNEVLDAAPRRRDLGTHFTEG